MTTERLRELRNRLERRRLKTAVRLWGIIVQQLERALEQEDELAITAARIRGSTPDFLDVTHFDSYGREYPTTVGSAAAGPEARLIDELREVLGEVEAITESLDDKTRRNCGAECTGLKCDFSAGGCSTCGGGTRSAWKCWRGS